MTTMEKPQSNRAKSFHRHNGKQDHGDAAGRKGREDYGYGDRQWAERGAINTDKTYLKEVIRDGLAGDEPTPDEIQFEDDRISAELDSVNNVEEFEGRRRHEAYMEGQDISELLDELYGRAGMIVRRLNALPRTSHDQAKLDKQKDELEGELDVVKSLIDIYEGAPATSSDYDRKSTRGIDKAMAKRVMLDPSFDEDDPDDENINSHIRISNRPR